MLYLALAEKNLYDCIRSEKKDDWEKLKKKIAENHSMEIRKQTFFLEHVVAFKKSTKNEIFDCSKKNYVFQVCGDAMFMSQDLLLQ